MSRWNFPPSSRSISEDALRPPTLAEEKLNELESVFAALAHEQRRHILLTLKFRGGELTAGQIADRFHCSWPTTSRHLKVLQDAGLIGQRKHGRERRYALDQERLHRVVGDWLSWFGDEKTTQVP